MGQLIDGIWKVDEIRPNKVDGTYKRENSVFRDWISEEEGAEFLPESGRYHLYISHACPWAHRTLIFRVLKNLEDHISVDVVHPEMLENGWAFDTKFSDTTGDSLYGKEFLSEIYTQANNNITCRVTVPILLDKKSKKIVSNESADIIRIFNSSFDKITGNTEDFWPKNLQKEIEPINKRIYETLNNGVYRAGFATSQSSYDEAVTKLFDTMEWLEEILSNNRFLLGDRVTEADWRLFPTLARFDSVYHFHFKCNRKRLIDYKNLWAYTRDLYQTFGISKTVHLNHAIRHYYYSHASINPHQIIPINPIINFNEPHKRS
ncbi:MAG: glutathione S-transferase family protein [Paracoccaceae bacterium]|jgi:putative glutathione S-transferase|nr:glutathione S-transferase family protein [Paracoccaceae bacterium]|tara:strand:- start:973 stop:1929 length:957 start_codon:yes stop_codon:yes gene_type:complete